jgi:selenocysteine lyase/cysteine desulfurase
MSAPDAQRLRADTPAAQAGIHLNNASAALMPAAVARAMQDYLHDESVLGHHAAAERHAAALHAVQSDLARLLGTAQSVECFDTVSRAMALLLDAIPWRPGDRLLIARHEWGAVIAAAGQLAVNCGVIVQDIPAAAPTRIDRDWLQHHVDDRVRAICVPLHTAAGGDACLTVDLPRPPGCLVFGDAAQALGQMPFALDRSGYDVVVGTARKWLRGPRGISFAGFSPAGHALLERARWLASAPQAAAVTSDYTRLLRIGLGAAARYALEQSIDAVQARVLALAGRLAAGLRTLDGIELLHAGAPRSGIVAFTAGGRESALVQALARDGIRVALIEQRYHPGLFQDLGVAHAVRMSAHVYNTEHEIDHALARTATALAG